MHDEVYAELTAYFQAKDIPYREIQHDPGAATEDYHQALGCRYEQQAKCLFLKVKQGGGAFSYAICTIQAQKRADLRHIAEILNAKEVKMGTQEALYEITGCHFGELPPAASMFGLQLLMDADFFKEDEIFLNAGRVDVSFVIQAEDLHRLENPTLF
jgi:Ala-tRNA(Pro) deacylase